MRKSLVKRFLKADAVAAEVLLPSGGKNRRVDSATRWALPPHPSRSVRYRE